MAFNLNEFRSQMQGDGARPNLFEVSMPFPAFALPGNAQTKMSFMCKTAQLPGSTVDESRLTNCMKCSIRSPSHSCLT